MRGVGKIQSLKIHSQFLAQARSVIVFGCARVRIICLTLRVLTSLVFIVCGCSLFHWPDCLFHWSDCLGSLNHASPWSRVSASCRYTETGGSTMGGA